jgi:hypothetical protein
MFFHVVFDGRNDCDIGAISYVQNDLDDCNDDVHD